MTLKPFSSPDVALVASGSQVGWQYVSVLVCLASRQIRIQNLPRYRRQYFPEPLLLKVYTIPSEPVFKGSRGDWSDQPKLCWSSADGGSLLECLWGSLTLACGARFTGTAGSGVGVLSSSIEALRCERGFYVLPVDWELVDLHKQTGVDAIFHAKEALEQLG